MTDDAAGTPPLRTTGSGGGGLGGLAVGVAGGGGWATTAVFGTGSIHHLAGLSFQVEGGGGHGILAKGSAGGWIGSRPWGLAGSRGFGAGAYVAAQAAGCKLLWSVNILR